MGWRTLRVAVVADGNNLFFTIGHSTRMIAQFVTLLGLLVDVRSIPRSRISLYFFAFGSGAASLSCALRGPVRWGIPVTNAL
jgi:hypothetical protein